MSLGARRRTATAHETETVGAALAADLRPGDVLLLEGELAAGKTTLVRGLVAGLGGDPDEVSSPTFVLVQTYPVHHGPIRRLHHVDLYRLADSSSAQLAVGLDDLLADPAAVVAVEWPRQAFAAALPAASRTWHVTLTIADDERRELDVALRG